MPGVLTRRVRAEELPKSCRRAAEELPKSCRRAAEELPKSWQKEMGVEARPGVQFELTLTEIGEVADERARQVKRLLDEIEPVERNRFRRKLLELIAEDFIHVRAATEANLMASADMAATETHGQSHIRTFDAVFHALAIAEQAILLTADEKHRNKTAATFGSVALIGELEM